MRISGTYFDLTDRRVPAVAAGSKAPDLPGAPSTLIISVAKRIVPSAVRRNTVKRIAREAWRANREPEQLDEAQRLESRQPEPRPVDAGASVGRTWMLRLKIYPGRARRIVAKARVKASANSKGTSASLRKGAAAQRAQAAPAPLPGFAAVKRLLRADADQLLQQALKRAPTSIKSPSARRRPVQ